MTLAGMGFGLLVSGLLALAGVQISMDGKGRALDNVIIERFWRNLKYDDVYLKGYTTPRAARHSIADYMRRYNDIRLHQALGYQTPGSVYRGDRAHPDGENGGCG
jgi:putative transposase